MLPICKKNYTSAFSYHIANRAGCNAQLTNLAKQIYTGSEKNSRILYGCGCRDYIRVQYPGDDRVFP